MPFQKQSREPDAPPAPVGGSGVIPQLIFTFACALIGAMILFVAEISIPVICRLFCIALMVCGGIFIIWFFASGAYKRLNQYGFAAGVLLLLLGICGMIRAEALANAFQIFVGFAVLLLGVMMLQDSMQLLVLGGAAKTFCLVLTGLSLLMSVLILAGFAPLLNAVPAFPQIALLIGGVFGIVCLLCKIIAVNRHARAVPPPAPEAAAESTLPEPPQEA